MAEKGRMATTTTERATVAELETAFAKIVDAIIEHRAHLKYDRSSPWKLVPFTPTYSQHTDLFGADPVSASLKMGLNKLGQIIFDLYGMNKLGEIAERVCQTGPGSFSARMSPVDSALNGVGRGNIKW